MITLSQPSNKERGYVAEAPRPAEVVETAGSLAMLYADGLLTMGQYDEFISNNPFTVDYAMYSSYQSTDSTSDGGFLSNFSSAVASIGSFGGGFSGGGFSSGACSSGSCGGFSSVC